MHSSKHTIRKAVFVQAVVALMLVLASLSCGGPGLPDVPLGTDPPPSSGGDTQDFYHEGEIAAAFTGDPFFGAFAVHENGERIVAITETVNGGIQRVTGAVWLGSEDQAMRQAMMRAAALTITLVMSILAGCTISFFGRADSGIEVEADYGARYEESRDGRQTGGIRHGDFDLEEGLRP